MTSTHFCVSARNLIITYPNTFTRTTTQVYTSIVFTNSFVTKTLQQPQLAYVASTVVRTVILPGIRTTPAIPTLTRTVQATATAFTPRTSHVMVTTTITSTAKQTRITVLSLTASVTSSFMATPLLSLNGAGGGAAGHYFLGSNLVQEGGRGWWILVLVGVHLLFG